MLKRYRFLIPLVRDDTKKRHKNRAYNDLERVLVAKFGGYTREDTVLGVWVDASNNRVCDHSFPYVVAIPAEAKQSLLDIVDDCKQLFGQQCIYLEHPNGDVELR